MLLDEPQVLDATRSWADSQEALAGALDPNRKRHDVACGWYDSIVDDQEGALCVIRIGSDLEELVGDVVRVDYDDRSIFVYCLGGYAFDPPMDLGLTRQAFAQLSLLSRESLPVIAQVVR